MKKILTFMFAATLLASCQQEENETTTVDTNSRITIAPIITRATEVDFENTDQIGVTITQSNDFVYASNKLMTFNDGVFTGDLLWYPEGNDESQIVAYYPYHAAGTPTSFTVKADQTDQATGYGASDLIAASKSGVLPSANAIVMNFKHILTKLVINIENETQSNISSVILKGSVPTATLDLTALSVTADENATAADITAQAVAANETYRAIVIPQTVAFTLEVATADGKTLSQKLTSTTLAQGGQYSVNVRVLPDDIIVTLSGKIESWTDEGEIGADNEVAFEEHLDENYFLYDGLRYNTVTLANGTTWMAEPLAYLPKGYTPSTDPTADSHVWYPYEIVDGAAVSLTEENSIKELGYLYDLQAALGGKEITESNVRSFEGAQGICPKGWHIPTRMEFVALCGLSNAAENESGNLTDANALFYDASYTGGKLTKYNSAGWNYTLTGMRWFTTTPKYQTTGFTSTNTTEELLAKYEKRPALTYIISSSYAKTLTSGDIQFFAQMTTFTKSYLEGRINVAYSSSKSGMQLRCVRD